MTTSDGQTGQDLSSPLYTGSRIVNIRFGKENRSHILYANLVDKDGGLLIAATLDYIVEVLNCRLPK